MAEEKERVLTYEVQIYVNGRWEIYSRFPFDAKDSAIEVAQDLERNKSTANVKVVKEVYNYASNSSSEALVYKSGGTKVDSPQSGKDKKPDRKPEAKPAPPAPRKETKKEAPKKAAGPSKGSPPASEPEPQEEKPRASLAGVVLKLLVITLLAAAFAAGASTLVTMGLKNSTAFGVMASKQTAEAIVLATFIVSFLLSAVPMALYSLSRENLNFDFGLPRRRVSAEPQATAATAEAVKATTKANANLSVGDRKEAEKRVADVVAGNARSDDGEGPQAKPRFEMPSAPKEPPPMSPHGERQKALMMKYLGDSLAQVASSRRMDNYNKFGVNLFLAGACEALGSEKQLDVLTTSRILGETVQTIGFKKTQAQSFADKYQDYLLADSRYMAMFESGRAAMAAHLAGDKNAAKLMDRALDDWGRPKDAGEKQSVVTVMFTDMVGSTALTQSLGDAGAQKVVRVHNAIVRTALGRFRGKEIKHTGDGIMASFGTATDGIGAAIDIQKQTAEHNKANPNLPLRLKVGLHSGQAIAEDDDLFGTHVQLAARIVDKAGAGEVFVSETAHGVCAGKDFRFINRGQFGLKGFADPQTVYQVVIDGLVVPPAPDKEAEEKKKGEGDVPPPPAAQVAQVQPPAQPPSPVQDAAQQQAIAQVMRLQAEPPADPAPAQPVTPVQPAPTPAQPSPTPRPPA
ncbi:MAG: adenylate/guanylate cyclase domain-containing protein [Magnetospirillum sp. WYHS-4]